MRVEEVSIGDYVLAGGEAAALVMIEAVVRLLPNVMGNPLSHQDDSHSAENAGLLEGPSYTRPPSWRGLEVPDPVWKAVADVHGAHSGAGVWDAGPGGHVLAIVLQLSVLLETAWHPCEEVRGLDASESGWIRQPERIREKLPGLEREFRDLVASDAFPEAGLGDPTRMFPFSGGGRKFAYLRDPSVLVPDPLEQALHQLGDVELLSSPEEFVGVEDGVRVACNGCPFSTA